MKNSILFLLGSYPSIGGVESVVTNLSNELVKEGHRVTIVSFKHQCEMEKMGLDENVTFLSLTMPVYSSKNKKMLRNYVRDNHVDIIINEWCLPFYVTMLLRAAVKGTTCKIVQAHQNLPTTNARLKHYEINLEEHIGWPIVNKLMWHVWNIVSRMSLRYAYDKCDRFVFLSQSFIPAFSRYIFKTEAGKCLSIPETFDSTADGSLPAKDKEILYLGRIDYNQKRVRRVIDIWNELEGKHPDWHLTIVGDGPDMPTVKQMVRDYNLKNVFFEGFQKGDKYYRRAPLMLLVSEYEGFGIVLIEAQSHGCVPIALDSYTALHDIVKDGENGVIISYPYAKEAFVEATEKLMTQESLRNELAQNAIASLEKFTMPFVLKQWNELFNELN